MAQNATPADNGPDDKVTGRRIDRPDRGADMEAPPEQSQPRPGNAGDVQEVETVEDAGVSPEPMPTPEDAEPADDVKRVTTVDGNDGVTRRFPDSTNP